MMEQMVVTPLRENGAIGTQKDSVHVAGGGAVERRSSLQEYRVAVAQISTYPGQIESNVNKIVDYIERARMAGAKLVVFPEMAIPGYQCLDLLFNPAYVSENIAGLQRIRAASAGMTVVVGFVESVEHGAKSRPGGRPYLYNAAAIIHDGKLVGIQHKSLLPNYEIFNEERYFIPGQKRQVFEVGGIRLGIEICEDLWSDGYPIDPSLELAQQGADLIVNLSASPFHVGKFSERTKLLQATVGRTTTPIVYANLVGTYDAFEGEVLFDGRSLVLGRDASVLGIGPGFSDDLLVVDLGVHEPIELPKIDRTAELHHALVMGIRDYFNRRSRATGAAVPKAIIGLSGGIDSALVAALCVEALGVENVIGVTMPSRYTSQATLSDAFKLAQNLGVPCKIIPIDAECRAVEESLRGDADFAARTAGVTEENIQARIRMVNLMAFANKFGGIMVNTGNKTELIMNNCTIYGDMTGGFSVLGDVDKDRVYDLARYVNERAGQELIPESTISRVPSAELKENQADENVMGAPPQALAPVAREIFEQGLTLTEAIERFGNQFSESVIRKIFVRSDEFEWKSRQMPPALRVTPHAYGIGRRMPMNHGFYK